MRVELMLALVLAAPTVACKREARIYRESPPTSMASDVAR